MERKREERRVAFDHAALLYDEARPGYPSALFDDVVALAALPAGGRILEIGPGTGQATLPLARRGYRIVAVELGAGLAAVARRNLAPFPGVTISVGTFEDWPVEPGAFDLAVSATAFHWIDPAIGLPKIAEALRPGGAAAIWRHEHVHSEASAGFFEAVQAVYEREAPHMASGYRGLPRAEEVPAATALFAWTDRADEARAVTAAREDARSALAALFDRPVVRRYRWDQEYDAAGYLRLLGTYSDHLRLPDAVRDRLFRGIADLIERGYGGKVTKGYLALLQVARRA